MSAERSQQGRRRRPAERSASTPAARPVGGISEAVRAQIEAWAEEACAACGVALMDLECATTKQWLVRVYAQRPGNPGPGEGITIDECAQVSRHLEALLDVDDRIHEAYLLEVSSPGIERQLKRPKHFEQVVGSRVRCVLREALNGTDVLDGVALGVTYGEAGEEPVVRLRVGDVEVGVPHAQLKRAQVVYDFGSDAFGDEE